jgi:hypothetical protein
MITFKASHAQQTSLSALKLQPRDAKVFSEDHSILLAVGAPRPDHRLVGKVTSGTATA